MVMVEYMRMVGGDLRERALLTELVGGSVRVRAGPPLTADWALHAADATDLVFVSTVRSVYRRSGLTICILI